MADEHDDQEWSEIVARDCMNPAPAHPDAEWDALADADNQEWIDIPYGTGVADSIETNHPAGG